MLNPSSESQDGGRSRHQQLKVEEEGPSLSRWHRREASSAVAHNVAVDASVETPRAVNHQQADREFDNPYQHPCVWLVSCQGFLLHPVSASASRVSFVDVLTHETTRTTGIDFTAV